VKKGSFGHDYVPLCNFNLKVEGLIELDVVEVSGLDQKIETVEFEDKIVHSLGRKGTLEFTVKFPIHAGIQMAALDLWWYGSLDPAQIGYKHNATLMFNTVSGEAKGIYLITGMFPSGRKYPNFNRTSSEVALEEWTFKADDLIIIP